MNRRLPVIVIIVGALVAGLLVDRAREDAEVTAGEGAAADDVAFPVAPGAGALSAAWFCAGGTGDEERFADHSVEIANPTDAPVTVTVTVFGGTVAPPLATVEAEDLDGEEPAESDATTTTTSTSTSAGPPAPVEREVELAARDRASLRLADLLAAPVVSALVEAPGAGVVVEHRIASVHGFDVKPCATGGATTWHFAYGDTTVDARELLVLFNPFPDDAIVEARFSTEDGVREPQRWTDGVVVPARSTLAVDVGDDVTRREEVAASLVARTGRIVVDRIVRVDADTDRGITLQTGVPAPLEAWVYPDGRVSDTLREEYVVYNPTEQLAEVEIQFLLDEPEVNGIPESVDLSLAPGAHQVVDVNADGRIPPHVSHSAVVRSANGVPVVSERVIFAAGESSGARKGISVTTGSPLESQEWSFAAGAVTGTTDEWLVIVNLDPQILAEVDVTAVVGGHLVPVADLQDVEIGPGQRFEIRVGTHIANRDALPIVVTSSEPVVVERGMASFGEDHRGLSASVGIPSPQTLRFPLDPLAAEVDEELGEVPADDQDPQDVPEAPDDVELPEPDETIVIEDPDAEAESPPASAERTTTTSS